MNKESTIQLAGWFDHISDQEKINLSRHLAIIIKAGIPLFEGLKIIRGQTHSKVLAKILDQVIVDVSNGKFLADSLDQYRRVFGEFFINIIRVGEASGTLSQNLFYLSDEIKKSRALKGKVKSAMIYPIIIFIATIGLSAFMAFFIFPKILPVFQSLNVKLPVTTLALIWAIDFVKLNAIYLALGAFAFVIGMKVLLRKVSAARYLRDRFIFAVPVLANLVISVNMANFTRILGLLLKSGVKIVEAVQITGDTFQNMVYQRAMYQANEHIRKGEQFAEYLETQTKFFPDLLVGMIKVGENTGNLEENLFYLSDYYLEEVDEKLHNLTNLMEPIMLLFMGSLVGFIALSIITPMYSISQGLTS